MIGSFGSLEQAEAQWARVKERFMKRWNLWGMPQAWWRFEPGIPEELRCGPALILTDADADTVRELDEARRRYLRSIGIDPTPEIGRPFASR